MGPPPGIGNARKGPTDQFVRRNLRHNLLALGLDFGLFLIGLSFASQSTIMPAFFEHLGAPNIVIGAIPAVMTLGWYLPSLFAANYTQTLTRKLPFILKYTVWERVPVLVLAVVAFTLAYTAPGLAMAVSLVVLLVMASVGGLLVPAWMDIIGRVIPVNRRGRFFSVATVIGSVGGLAGSAVTAAVLGAYPALMSYGLCFLGGAVFLGVSYGALVLVREPPAEETSPAIPLLGYLRDMPALVASDRNLGWFLVSRALGMAGTMAAGFFTVDALRSFAVPAWQVGVFTAVLLVGQTVGNLLFGWFADRSGHRLVLAAGLAASALAALVALLAPAVELYAVAFALSGLQLAATNVSSSTVLLEFAPAEVDRPTYIGLGNTTVAPIAFLAPLVGGALADTVGFDTVFGLSAVLALAGFAVMVGRVQDPRFAGKSVGG